VTDESSLPPPRHEPTDISERLIWIGIPALVITVVALSLAVLWLFPGRTVDRTLHLPLPRFPSPGLQINDRSDMEQFRAQQLQQLNSNGKGHIPIDEAMRKVAQDGLPDWP
jgi:hypothetical protein